MSRIYDDKYDSDELVILPEGEVTEIVFETGLAGCGQAVDGMGVRFGKNTAGGVLTNDDLLAIRHRIDAHFANLAQRN